MDYSVFTPAQLRILEVLSDGLPHRHDELMPCLLDELGSRKNLGVMICKMRKHLRPRGHDIICEFSHRRTFYRHVRLLVSSE
jgi:hypothetical protein